MTDRVHVYHTAEEHCTDALDCWCVPYYLIPCDECESGCWKCTDGTITVTRRDAETHESRLIVVHNR